MSKTFKTKTHRRKEDKKYDYYANNTQGHLYTQPSKSNFYLLSTMHFPSNDNDYCSNKPFQVPHLKNKIHLKPILNQSVNLMEKPNRHYKLYNIEAKDIDDSESRDLVPPMTADNFLLRNHIKTYFKYGKFDKPSYINIHFEKLITKFYTNKENAINFLFDTYLVPHLKCNLNFRSHQSPIVDLYKLLENNCNLLEHKVKLKLCQERKLSQIIKDNYEMTHMNNNETYDFSSCAYLNNKYNYSTVSIASDVEKKAVFNYPLTLTKKYIPSKTKGFIKRLLTSHTHHLPLTNLLKLHLDLHQKSTIFTEKSLHQLNIIQRFAEKTTQGKNIIKTDDIF